MLYIKDEVIILRNTPAGEKDTSLTVYTKTLGKENIYVKGGQIVKHPLLPVIQEFNWFKGVLVKYKEKLFIKEVDKSFLMAVYIAKNIKKFETATFVLNIFNRFTTFPDEKMFMFLKSSLYNLSQLPFKDYNLLKLYFLLRYVKLHGIFPQVSRCVKCKAKITRASFGVFSFKEGGSICKICQKQEPSNLNFDELVLISKLLKKSYKDLQNVKINEKTSQKLTDTFLKYLADYFSAR